MYRKSVDLRGQILPRKEADFISPRFFPLFQLPIVHREQSSLSLAREALRDQVREYTISLYKHSRWLIGDGEGVMTVKLSSYGYVEYWH
jgi:hypothetical protein